MKTPVPLMQWIGIVLREVRLYAREWVRRHPTVTRATIVATLAAITALGASMALTHPHAFAVGASAGRDSGDVSGARSDTTSQDLVVYVEETPGMPIALPAALPPGYQWLGPHSTTGNYAGLTVVRTSLFAMEPLTAGPIVAVCVQRAGPDLCVKGDERLVRHIDGYTIRIVFYTGSSETGLTDADKDFWSTVDFDFDGYVSWLPER